MKKESYYFSHDYNSRNDRKMVKLRLATKMEGVGIYWCLVEMLYEEGGEIALSEVPVFASEWKVKEATILRVIYDFELFKNDGEVFWSDSANRRLDVRTEKSQKARESAEKRWRNAQSNNAHSDSNANALQTHSDGNARKERKGKEIKGNEMKDENTAPASPSSERAGTKVDKAKAYYRNELETAAASLDTDKGMLESYRTMANYLFGVNPTNTVYQNILSLPKQVSFAQFQKMEEVSRETKVNPVTLFDEMENWKPLTKKNESVHLTCINWMRRNA
jgi:hypothetical protein